MSVEGKGFRIPGQAPQPVARARAASLGAAQDGRLVGSFGGKPVWQVPGPAPSRPRSASDQEVATPLTKRRAEHLAEAPHAGRMMRQREYTKVLSAANTPEQAKAAAARLPLGSTLTPSELLGEFGERLRKEDERSPMGRERLAATLDGLLDGLKAANGGTLSKAHLSAYLAFASHLPDGGSMAAAERAHLCLSRLALAWGADVNAMAQPAATSVGEHMASTMTSQARVLIDKQPGDAAELFAVAMSHANVIDDAHPLPDGVLKALMAQRERVDDAGFKALVGGLLQGSGVRAASNTEQARTLLDNLVRTAAAQYQSMQPANAPVVPAAGQALLDFCEVLGQELHAMGRGDLREPAQTDHLVVTIQASLPAPMSGEAVQAFQRGLAHPRQVPVPADPPLGPPPDVKAQSADDKRIAQATSQYNALMDRITKNRLQESTQHLMSDIIACAVKLHKVDETWPTKLMAAMKQRLGGAHPDKALITMCLNKFAHAALNETLNPNKDNWDKLTPKRQQELESSGFFSDKTRRSLGVDNNETVLMSLMAGFTQALGGDQMTADIRTHCLKVVTHLNYLTLDEPQVVARLFRGLGYKIEEVGLKITPHVALTENERAKILVATKLFPADWKRDKLAEEPALDAAAANADGKAKADPNQPAAPVASQGANSITSRLTEHIGQGRAYEAGKAMVEAHRNKQIKREELAPLAKQIVASLYQGPEWRVHVDEFMRGWAAQARGDADDPNALPAEEVLEAVDDAADDDANATSEEQSKHRNGFVTLAPYLLRKDYAGATAALNDIRAHASDSDRASWSAVIAPNITQ